VSAVSFVIMQLNQRKTPITLSTFVVCTVLFEQINDDDDNVHAFKRCVDSAPPRIIFCSGCHASECLFLIKIHTKLLLRLQPFYGPLSRYQKGKTSLDLLEQEIVSELPAAQPTASKHTN